MPKRSYPENVKKLTIKELERKTQQLETEITKTEKRIHRAEKHLTAGRKNPL
jgi:predicted  nucleic acid-binding Zn-ribbon protein